MNPLFATVWDANHAWIQWEGLSPVGLRVCYRPPGREWTDWLKVGLPWPVRSFGSADLRRFKIPTQRQNCLMRVELSVMEDGAWIPARVASLARVKARFRLTTGSAGYVLNPALAFACANSGGVAAYAPLERRIVPPDSAVEFEAESFNRSPFNELDEPGQFSMRPVYEAAIVNLAPSSRVLLPGEGNESLVSFGPKGEPQAMAFGARLSLPVPG